MSTHTSPVDAPCEDQEEANRRPSFQFYPMDWLTDPALCACSVEAQGAWMRLICVMHQCPTYGHLSTNGKPMEHEEIRRHLPGFSLQKVRKTMEELEENGVFSLTAEGVIYSRRMVRDEAVRLRRAAGGAKGAKHGIKGAASRSIDAGQAEYVQGQPIRHT